MPVAIGIAAALKIKCRLAIHAAVLSVVSALAGLAGQPAVNGPFPWGFIPPRPVWSRDVPVTELTVGS